MTRVIGPPRSRRRRWTFLWCLVVVLGVGTFFVAGAQAVHATGIFQLDSDASQSLNTDGNAGQSASSEDWDNVCARYVAPSGTDNNPGQFCHPVNAGSLPSPTAATGANGRSTFITDGFNVNDSVFKGGTDVGGITSADGIGGSLWQWKTASAPDKSDIEQAFAAEYTCNAATHCTNAAYSGHTIIYFGGTRFADSGDTNLGFWFLHNNVTACGAGATCTAGSAPTCPLTSGCGFTGGHQVGNCSLAVHPTPCTPGDIFVASAFTAHPTIQIYEFVGLHNADTCITSECDLNPVPFPVNAATGDNTCTTSASDNDAGCAIINKTAVASPWLFTDKTTGAPANTFGVSSKGGELFEGGLDLTQLGFGGACISTFMLNTRSSGSGIGSVDQDFALGSMGGCGSTLTTTAAGNANGLSIGSGTVSSGTDAATVGVTGVANWSGTVDFYICGPLASSTAVCSTGGVKANGTTGNAAIPVSQNTTFPINSGTATLSSAGRYCWFSHFTSSTTGVPSQDEDGSTDTALTGTSDPNPECFNVSKVTPTLSTTALVPNSTPPPAFIPAKDPITSAIAAVPFGSNVYDSGTLSGAATEPGSGGANSTYPTINPTVAGSFAGTIGFTLKGPDGASANCSTNATPFNSSETQTFPITVNVTGNVTYGGDGSIHYKPGSPGTYHWIATYTNTGSANNTTPVNFNSSCTDTGEDVVVQQIPTSMSTTQKTIPQDSATITSTQAGDNIPPGGTVTFYMYNSQANCQAHGTTVGSGGLLYKDSFPTNASGGNPPPANSETFNSANTVSVNDNTNVYWRVTYATGDTAHTGRQSDCVENAQTAFTNDSAPGTLFP